ncbi:spore coat protein [Oceanobacillus saliphilus]|uniref:spore coat protein n=1 Tax=Oceanobacillus saliphilus TaxID=2925834 RepID=UPI00201D404A|nr:spore coat protein [Oceanobacillus saliphilus]
MSDHSKPQIPEKVVEVVVDSIFKKNGVKPEELKKNLSDEQKKMLKEMVEDLKKQVDQFNNKNKIETSE